MPDIYDQFAGLNNDLGEVELAIFKRVFLSDDGQYVLGRILETCKFMEPCKNEQDMALNNFAKELMATIYWDRNTKCLNIHRVIAFIKKRWRKENA